MEGCSLLHDDTHWLWEQLAHSLLKAIKLTNHFGLKRSTFLPGSVPGQISSFPMLIPSCHLPCELVFCTVCSLGQGRPILCVWPSSKVKVILKETINHYHGQTESRWLWRPSILKANSFPSLSDVCFPVYSFQSLHKWCSVLYLLTLYLVSNRPPIISWW